MAHFYGVLRGGRGEASRLGHKSSGLTMTAAGWGGAVRVTLRYDDASGCDMAHVALVPWKGSGVECDLYDGPVAGASAQDGPGSGLSASQGHDPALGRQEDARTGGAAAGASVALFAGAGAGGECPEGPGTPLDAPQGDDPARVDDPWLRGYRAGLKAGDSERARV